MSRPYWNKRIKKIFTERYANLLDLATCNFATKVEFNRIKKRIDKYVLRLKSEGEKQANTQQRLNARAEATSEADVV